MGCRWDYGLTLTINPRCSGNKRPTKCAPAQTLDDILDQMTRYNVLPKLINVTAEAGAPPIMPPDYVHRAIVKGQLAPLGRFRGPLVTHTNYSTLHLYGPGLDAFADWQVRAGAHMARSDTQWWRTWRIGQLAAAGGAKQLSN